MGYIVLDKQLQMIKQLTNRTDIDSVELLWLAAGVELLIWTKAGEDFTFLINKDGEVV